MLNVTNKQPTEHAMKTAWMHIDAINFGTEASERNLLTEAQSEIETVIDALMTPGPVNRNDLAYKLESVVNELRLAGRHLDDAVWALADE